MKARFTARADRDYASLSPAIRKTFAKQLERLLTDVRYPSLRAKKFDDGADLWQARVNRNWRFYFKIVNDEYVIIAITPHPK